MNNQANIQTGEQIGQPSAQYNRMDILFYNSIKISKRAYIRKIVFHIVRLLLLCIFLPIDVRVLESHQGVLFIFMGIAIAVVFLNLLITYAIFRQNNIIFLNMAKVFSHSVAAQPILQMTQINDIQKCVSGAVYNEGTGALNNNEGLTSDIRDRYQSINSSMISSSMLAERPCLSFVESNIKFLSFLTIIFGIVGLACTKPSGAEIGVLTTYIVLEAINIWIVVVAVVVIALSPIILCVCCFAVCCCQNAQATELPQSMEATAQMIEETDGSCSICIQPFKINEEVIRLPCSHKHMFHKGCIDGWVRISNTCPMCRKKINQVGPI